MTSDHFSGALNLLGQGVGALPLVSPKLGGKLEPKLDVAWGDFRQGVWSSVRAAFVRVGSKGFVSGGYFKDCWIERRVPRQALVAAALWHIAFIVLPPFPGLSIPKRNHALDNFQLTWSGPMEDLPVVEIPKQGVKRAARKAVEPTPEQGADAFHPRQRIYTDPVRPTHLRQTLVNPKAPFEPPKMLPELPNIVQLQQTVGPARPRLTIDEETLKKLRPKERHVKTVTVAPLADVPNMEPQVADFSLQAMQDGPARPKLEINAGAAPRVAQRAQAGDAGPAPDVGAAQVSTAASGASPLIALSATPGPAAPVEPPKGNLAAKVSISPDAGKRGGASAADTAGGGNSPVGISVSGGNPRAKSGVSGLDLGRSGAPSVRGLMARPPQQSTAEEPERVGPPNFAALPPGAKPEAIFASKRVYTMNVNMPNLNSSTGSWILNFSELHPGGVPHVTSSDLNGPAPLKKVDPKYPPALIADRVEGQVVLYAVIRGDGSVDSMQLVHGVDEQLDANAMSALAQWKFRPAMRQGTPVDLEAIVYIPFRLPREE